MAHLLLLMLLHSKPIRDVRIARDASFARFFFHSAVRTHSAQRNAQHEGTTAQQQDPIQEPCALSAWAKTLHANGRVEHVQRKFVEEGGLHYY